MNTDTNTDTNLNTLIVYHGPNCIDGFTAAWVTASYCQSQGIAFDLYEMGYSDADYTDFIFYLTHYRTKYGKLIVVDFSFNLDKCEHILDTCTINNILILDHHKTAMAKFTTEKVFHKQNYLDGQVCVIFDQTMSGANIAHHHFNSYAQDIGTPWIIKYVEDYDLWKFNLGDDTKAIHMLLDRQERTLENWQGIADSLEREESRDYILQEGYALLEEYKEQVFMYAANASSCTIAGETGLMVSCPGEYINDVAHDMATTCGTFGLVFNEIDHGLKLKCSIRANGDYDVERIAKLFGGGGHRSAAGFIVDYDKLEEFAEAYRVEEISIAKAMGMLLEDPDVESVEVTEELKSIHTGEVRTSDITGKEE